jgi:hypothetical protein
VLQTMGCDGAPQSSSAKNTHGNESITKADNMAAPATFSIANEMHLAPALADASYIDSPCLTYNRPYRKSDHCLESPGSGFHDGYFEGLENGALDGTQAKPGSRYYMDADCLAEWKDGDNFGYEEGFVYSSGDAEAGFGETFSLNNDYAYEEFTEVERFYEFDVSKGYDVKALQKRSPLKIAQLRETLRYFVGEVIYIDSVGDDINVDALTLEMLYESTEKPSFNALLDRLHRSLFDVVNIGQGGNSMEIIFYAGTLKPAAI